MHRILGVLLALCVGAVRLSAQPAALPITTNAVQDMRNGDVLRVAISREPTLGGDFPVDDEGYVTLPLLGRRRAIGIAWPSLRDSLLTAYRRELRSESISLIPLRRVYVLGSVLKPGVYLLEPTLGLQGAISVAGGAAPDGDVARIRVQRDGTIMAKHVSLNTPPSEYEVRSGDELFVERRSWLDRNSTLLFTSIISVAGIIVTLASRN